MFRRAAWVIDSAKSWLSQPPKAGVIHQKSHNGKVTVESEVAHLKGIGPYASDAWRIFYKDELYRQAGFDVDAPEWTTFQPKDKELCAYIKWKRAVSQKQSSSKENQEPEELLTGLKKLSLGDSV